MPKRVVFLAGLAALTALSALMPRIATALAHLEVFRVTSFELEGETHLTLEEGRAAAAVPADASVWDDPAEWEASLARHPLVRSARVRKRLPRGLVFVVEEREPVALAPLPTLTPVDAQGRVLPIDPAAYRMDLPLLGVERSDERPRLGTLAAEVARLGRVDPAFLARVSELAEDGEGDLVAHLADPAATFRFSPAVSPWRLREGLTVLADASARAGRSVEWTVDLRFADQVVLREPGARP